MSLRVIVRVIVPPSFRVVKSVATSTQKFFRSYVTNNVATSSHITSMQGSRLFSQQAPAEEITVDYDYVKRKAAANDGAIIIDVREPEEVKEHGKIPNSINIPLANVSPVLSNVSEKEFKQMYQISKPKEDTELIFYCMIGKRSGKAQQTAISLGYKNAKNYLGSWTDWASRSQ
ncbi:rhodanese domain-containing protein CG4456-like [Anticarsia gemmatalis]|uniref:rhodanese domain-containing protein CG4456-like n=1 Tax=Anticarsia gemmatalis TaxID=129554 RepID=UPI003F76C3E1